MPSLTAVLRSRHDVIAVVTRPDAPTGRGRTLLQSPVARVAASAGVEVLKPRSAADPTLRTALSDRAPDAGVVVAYGALLRPAVLDIPRHGWVNLHFSLLPAWRGAAPVAAAIRAGDDMTGATTFLLDEGLDTGPVYGVMTEPIDPRDTAGELLDRLAPHGGDLLVATLDGIEDGTLEPRPQPAEGVSYAPKITVAAARIDWTQSATAVDRHVRAMTPDPGAWTETPWGRLRLGPVTPIEDDANAPDGLQPGALVAERRRVLVGTGAGVVRLEHAHASGSPPHACGRLGARRTSARRDRPRGPGRGGRVTESSDHGQASGRRHVARRGRPRAATPADRGRSRDGERGRRGPASRPPTRRPPEVDPARQAALDVLAAVRARGAYANLTLPPLLTERGITGRDAALATELTYGTCRTLGQLDAVHGACGDREVERLDGAVVDALRLGTYQLLHTRIPPHAAVSATVELVRAGERPGAAGYVNAVLRRVSEADLASWVDRLAPDEERRPARPTRGGARAPAVDRRGLRRRPRRRPAAPRTGGGAGRRRRARRRPPRRASRNDRPRPSSPRRPAARPPGSRRTACTCPAATPVGSPRSWTAGRRSRTRARSSSRSRWRRSRLTGPTRAGST